MSDPKTFDEVLAGLARMSRRKRIGPAHQANLDADRQTGPMSDHLTA